MPVKKTKFETAFSVGLSNEQLTLIGAFIVTWNQVELLMTLIVALALDTTGDLIEEIMSTPNIVPKTRIFRQAVNAKVSDKDIQKIALKCANEISGLSNFRNSIAHGFWANNEFTGDPISAKTMLSPTKVGIDDVEAKLSQICLLSLKMADLFWRINHFKTPIEIPLPSLWHGKF